MARSCEPLEILQPTRSGRPGDQGCGDGPRQSSSELRFDVRMTGKIRRRSPPMKLVSAAVDRQQATAEPKDRISGCSSASPGGIWEKKVRLNFLSSAPHTWRAQGPEEHGPQRAETPRGQSRDLHVTSTRHCRENQLSQGHSRCWQRRHCQRRLPVTTHSAFAALAHAQARRRWAVGDLSPSQAGSGNEPVIRAIEASALLGT